MNKSEENFYDYVYGVFYGFSHAKPEEIGVLFSTKNIYPTIRIKPNVQMTIPLPKKIGDDYAFLGLLFENTIEGKKSLWGHFLATLYHMAAHAAISNYSDYENWRKNKTEDSCWLVIDFIEDARIQKYIEQNDPIMWKNLVEIESKLMNDITNKNQVSYYVQKPHVCNNGDNEILESIKSRILTTVDGNKKELSNISDYLYRNRNLLQVITLPNREHHTQKWFLKFEEKGPSFNPSGAVEEMVARLEELWQHDELQKTRILRQYRKYMKNLHFDNIVIPTGNLQEFAQMKLKILPMLRRIRQQLRLVANLNDSPKIDQVGYVDMQMAIQAIASEGQSTDIFEREEIRRGEEAWIILVDKSASMNLRCQELKEFVVCMAESANELTGKSDAWAIFSFDTTFQILKDFKEHYSHEVQARIGSLKSGGLTLLPDALEVAYRALNEDPRERKYIFLVTDGHPCGYDTIHEAFSKIVKKTNVSGITLISIGISKKTMRILKNGFRGKDLKTLIAKFITAYKAASEDM